MGKEQDLLDAAVEGDVAAILKLLKGGVDVNCKSSIGTYLVSVCEGGWVHKSTTTASVDGTCQHARWRCRTAPRRRCSDGHAVDANTIGRINNQRK